MPFIDWTFFFSAWELKGRYPGILEHPEYGAAARELFDHAQALLKRIIDGKLLTARGVYGFWPANTDGDDIVVYTDDIAPPGAGAVPMLRQQEVIADKRPNRSLADFVAPRASGVPDYIGVFAVTAGLGADALAKQFEADHDDYNAIMVKALADRLAEAFAEYLHAQARQDFGYGDGEQLTAEELVAEQYRGIRPGLRLPGVPGPHARSSSCSSCSTPEKQGIDPDRERRHAAGRFGQRPLLLASRGEVLQRRPDRPRPARVLRQAQGGQRRGGGAVAGAEPRLRPGRVRREVLNARQRA